MSNTLAELRENHARDERVLVLLALTAAGWRLAHAARELGVQPSSLRRTIEKLGLAELYAEHCHGPGAPRLPG